MSAAGEVGVVDGGGAGAPRAVVVGAGGHLGSAVTRQLVARGWQVTGVGRRPTRPRNLDGVGVDYRVADTGAFDLPRGCRLVVDAAAPYPTDVSPFQLAGVHAAALRRLDAWLQAARGAGATFAYLGSFVTGPRAGGPLERWERIGRRALHPYFEVKRRLEERVLEAGASGLRTAIVHPTTCLGPWDLKPRELCLVPLVASGEIPWALSGPLNVVDVRDVARLLLEVAERGPWNRPVPARGHDLTVEMLCARIAQLAGVEPPRFVADGVALRAWSFLGDVAAATLGRLSPSAALAVALLREGRWAGSGAAPRLPGHVPTPLSRSLIDALDWARELGQCGELTAPVPRASLH